MTSIDFRPVGPTVVTLFLLSVTPQLAVRADTATSNLIPIVRVDSSSAMEVQIEFVNTSTKPMRYLLANDEKSIYPLEFLLFQRDKYIEPQSTEKPPFLSLDRIRELKSGQGLTHTVKLRQKYGKLSPGRYELKVRYNIPEGSHLTKEFGITPLTIKEHTVLYIDVK